MRCVRIATSDDRWQIIRLLEQSHTAAGYTFPFEAARADRLFSSHMENRDACVLVLDIDGVAQGVLMATAFDHPFGAGLWAKETVWYVAYAHRGKGSFQMLDAYEEWAKDLGCAVVSMATLVNNDISKIYERRGYAAAETHFVMPLG